MSAIVDGLRHAAFADRLTWHTPTPPPLSDVQRVHPAAYIDAVAQICDHGGGSLDPDTQVSPESFAAAHLAVGAWIEGCQLALHARHPVLVLSRPPGHHALPTQGMGFCVFANAAIAALWALEQPGIERVAIFDWDVHHGNGTQAIVANQPRCAYASIHQQGHYPWTGAAHERGEFGNVCNVPLAAGAAWPQYEAVMDTQILPFLADFRPDLLLVSAGFDCAAGDPLAEMALRAEDFGRLATLCLQVTPVTVFGLEGGYNLNNLAAGMTAVAQSCLAWV
ncbi:MAG: histone deacetylase [Synechococcales cyanobacterium]